MMGMSVSNSKYVSHSLHAKVGTTRSLFAIYESSFFVNENFVLNNCVSFI